MRYRTGLSGFGKYASRTDVRPPTSAPPTASESREILIMKHKHEMEMMKLRLEMAQMQRRGMYVPASTQRAAAQTTTAAGDASTIAATAAVAGDVAALKKQIDILKRRETVAKGGGAVVASGGKSVKEALTGKDSKATLQKFTPTTAKKGLVWDDWRRLKTRLPANFNEAKYLLNNPDIAAAVKRGQFPSGAWHYVMYGSANCAYGEKHAGRCDRTPRSFQGWRRNRRPGYLSGIFANWNQYD